LATFGIEGIRYFANARAQGVASVSDFTYTFNICNGLDSASATSRSESARRSRILLPPTSPWSKYQATSKASRTLDWDTSPWSAAAKRTTCSSRGPAMPRATMRWRHERRLPEVLSAAASRDSWPGRGYRPAGGSFSPGG